MNDVNRTVARKLRSAAAALRADAAASNFVNLREALLTEIVDLEKRADELEDQARRAEEPTEWGSLVRARIADHDSPVLLAYVPEPEAKRDSAYSWYSDQDSWHIWPLLTDVEVLRVGVGEQPLAEWESDHLNEQYRRDTAAAVLAAMDVDQYLIDAVANARPR